MCLEAPGVAGEEGEAQSQSQVHLEAAVAAEGVVVGTPC